MMLTKDKIIKKIEKNSEIIKSFGVKKIELFGSYAVGKQKKNSDIDFLVEFEKDRGLFRDYMDLLHLLEDTFNSEIDIVAPNKIRDELKPYILGGKRYAAKL